MCVPHLRNSGTTMNSGNKYTQTTDDEADRGHNAALRIVAEVALLTGLSVCIISVTAAVALNQDIYDSYVSFDKLIRQTFMCVAMKVMCHDPALDLQLLQHSALCD